MGIATVMITKAMRDELRVGRYERTRLGILLPRLGVIIEGRADVYRNKTLLCRRSNLLTTQGIDLITADLFPTTLYMALFSDDVTPDVSWTPASWATEITSGSEGYVESVRPLWPGSGADPAEFNIRTATTLTICGIGLLDGSSTKGDTTGNLVAAIRLADAPAPFDDHDILDIRYTITPIEV